MANIKRLLKKKGWTGQELGQIDLTYLAEDYRKVITGNTGTPNIVEPEQLQKMVDDNIKDKEQAHIYNGYVSIHQWIGLKLNLAIYQYQTAQLYLNKLLSFVFGAMDAEKTYQYIEQLPVVMTQKQYEDTKAERLEAGFKDEDGEDLQSNLFNLVERCVTYYLRKLQKEPQKANPLKAIRKKYLSEPVKSELILSRWNEVMGEGYYTLEDGSGRRSDQMTDEEWRAAARPQLQEALETAGEEDSVADRIASNREISRAKVIYNGGTEEDADEAQERADCEAGYATPTKWHTYTEPPTDLTKWDLIEQELLLAFYPADIDGSGDEYSESNFTASMEDFCSEFKELVSFALRDMDKKYFKDDLQVSKLPVEEWGTTLVSWRRLYDLDFYGEQEEAEARIFDADKRALYNGIAILKPSNVIGSSRSIDERGYYVEPELEKPIGIYSLESYFTDNEKYADNVDMVEDARNQLVQAYYYVLGYNAQIDLVAERYDVPELSVFKQDAQRLADRADVLDALVPILYKQIKDTDYRDKDLQARKMEVLQDIFPPVNLESYSIPEERKEQAVELFKDFRAFLQDRWKFDKLLCIKPAEGEGA